MAEAEDKGKGVAHDHDDGAPGPEREHSDVDDKDEEVAVDMPKPDGKPSDPAPAHKPQPPESVTQPPARYKDYLDPAPVPFWDINELYRWSLWRAGVAEFIASFLLLYIGVLTAIGTLSDGTCGGVGTLGIAFAFGVTVFVLVYCIAGISGGHINPAITFAMFLVRRVTLARALVYIIAQMLGALAGVGLVKAHQKGYYQRYGGGANFVHYGYSKGAGLVAEIVGTFLLVYVVFSATDAKRKARDVHIPVLAPLSIGLAVFVVHLATLPITGTGINPARSFAAASLWDHHDHAWHDQWIFWVGPLLGATLASMYYVYIIRALPFHNLDLASLRAGRSTLTV